MASSSKATLPTEPEEPEPINWMDAEQVLQQSTAMSQDKSRTQELEEEDLNMSILQREAYLEEMMSHEGHGYDPPDQCPDCCDEQAIYQCRSCIGQDLCCQACIVHRHALLPFHRVRVSSRLRSYNV